MIRIAANRAALVALLFFAAFPAFSKSWNISDFRDTISIQDDGTALVTESITCVFVGEYHGIHRRIPFQYPGKHGENYTLYLDFLKVADSDGNNLKYDLATKGAYRQLTIYIPGAVDATKTVNITYRVRNGIRWFDDYDEFYWNVTGNDWPVPIDHASATVMLPAKAQGSGLRAQAFTGAYGSTAAESTAKIENTTADFETTNPLNVGSGLTIDIYIPKNVLNEPSALTKIGWYVGSNPILYLPLTAFVVMFTLWYMKGRDPDPGLSVAPMYAPPDGMSPAEAGALLGDQVHTRDITSTLVDLAVKGYIKIEQTGEKHWYLNSSDYTFHLLKPRAEWGNLAVHEQSMMNELFDGTAGETTTLSSLKNHFYQALPAIRSNVMTELEAKGMYGLDPEHAVAYDVLGAVIIAAPFVLLQWSGAVNFTISGWLMFVCIGIAVGVVIFFSRIMPAKSIKGARTVVAVRGFQEFMNRVDRDRLRTMPPDTFEKFLPYAMALGVEERWAKAFEGLGLQPPTWYVGPGYPGVWNPIMFTNNMSAMTQAANVAFTSAPRASSGGSGFGGGGGGGFSGGGFGGGGGSAF